jgi:hypothetical protein
VVFDLILDLPIDKFVFDTIVTFAKFESSTMVIFYL